MYELLMLISDSEVKGLQMYAAAVKAEYASHKGGTPPGMRFIEDGQVLEIEFNGFRFYVMYNCKPSVLEESKEMAATIAATHPQRAVMAGAQCRFELNSSGDDPNMNYFNDMLFLAHAGTSLKGVYVFDPGTSEFY